MPCIGLTHYQSSSSQLTFVTCDIYSSLSPALKTRRALVSALVVLIPTVLLSKLGFFLAIASYLSMALTSCTQTTGSCLTYRPFIHPKSVVFRKVVDLIRASGDVVKLEVGTSKEVMLIPEAPMI